MKLSLFGLIASASAVVAKPALSIQGDLPFDENGKLESHHLLYPADNPRCPAASYEDADVHIATPLAGKALQRVFRGYEEGSGACPVACLERGTDRAVAHAIMPHKMNWDTSGNFRNWYVETCTKVEVCLMNYHSRDIPIKLYWISTTGDKHLHMEMEFGERKTRCFHSFLGHKFQAEDGQTGEVIDSFTVEFITSKAIGESPPSGDPRGHNFDREIESTLRMEWKKHKRINRTFSSLGFKKGRLPEDVFASIGSFYYNNRHYDVREEWKGKGVFVNWWETDCYFIQVPWDMKRIWQGRLRELVEAWAGVPVEQTDMYGLRKYVQGARLLTHVDRESTHAVSLIVNIAQGNLTEPWPVEANDHGDRLHEILMDPGDIVYYESAKALHGRNRPLMGPNAYYVNLFTHYRPTGDPKWMEKPNTPSAPDPLVDVNGDCRLEKVGIIQVPGQKLGVMEAVKCDDPRIEQTISPTLFKATSGEDLIEWWRYTGENRPVRSASAPIDKSSHVEL